MAFWVFIISCFFSFGVQYLFFLWYKFSKHSLIEEHKTVCNYYSGLLGDGVLVPFTNVFIALTIQSLHPTFSRAELFICLLMGFGITFIFHWGQTHYDLTNWTMPKKNHWTALGLYHAIFMFCESSFLSLALIMLLKFSYHNGIWSLWQLPIRYSLLVLAIFLLTFIYDYWHNLFWDLTQRKLINHLKKG
jgi:hypothetical protein